MATLIEDSSPEAIVTFKKLSKVRRQLSDLAFGKQGLQPYSEIKKQMDSLEKQKANLEAKLSQLSRAFMVNRLHSKIDCTSLAASLPDNSVLIDFAKYNPFDFRTKKNHRFNAAITRFLCSILAKSTPWK